MAVETRSFFQLALFSLVGLLFYYSGLFIGEMGDSLLFKAVAVLFLLGTIPLPFMAYYRKSLATDLGNGMRYLIVFGAMALMVHHFLLTYIIVMFSGKHLAM